MIEEIHIAGFRSLREVTLPLKKLNVIYGKNGSGKSSVAYACQVVKNIMTNPNRSLDSFFNLGFINLGKFEDITFRHDQLSETELWFKVRDFAFPLSYLIQFDHTRDCVFQIWNDKFKTEIASEFPYEIKEKTFTVNNVGYEFNGFSVDSIEKAGFLLTVQINSALKIIQNIECIPVKRGFFNPIYPIEESNPENRIADIIAKDEKGILVEKVNSGIKKIFEKEFRVHNIRGTQQFRMRTVKGEFITEIVNEGFGLNQTIAILIQLLKPETTLALIEEPEIHLHPTAQSALMEVFIEAIEKDNKQILLSTHSENIVSTILAKISEGTLSKDDVQFFLCTSEKGETKIEPQQINEHGQIEGGLMPFMESELENLKKMLKI
ncbi:MAG TPA: AAA family ATPase [Chitinophagales bacterium]|nr:AAA family ATPase [Chitinophagales bacterium]